MRTNGNKLYCLVIVTKREVSEVAIETYHSNNKDELQEIGDNAMAQFCYENGIEMVENTNDKSYYGSHYEPVTLGKCANSYDTENNDINILFQEV